MGPQVRSPLNLAVRLIGMGACLAFLGWMVWVLLTSEGGFGTLVFFGSVFAVLLLGLDLSQRRRHRHLVWLREREPVAFVLRERVVWETAWITANESSVVMWRWHKKVLEPVLEFDRGSASFESVVLPVSNFHQRPGLRMVVDGTVIDEFWLLHDRHGVVRRRLRGADEDRAVQRLLAGR